jgi:hypothetical protein
MRASTSGFALAVAVTAVFNTVLACVRDSYAGLNDFMKSLIGNAWTTHGLADLILFLGLGFILMKTGWGARMDPERVIGVLVGAVAIGGIGLVVWYAFV